MAGNPNARPVQLHVIHDLGGGSSKWLADYCKADEGRTNLVLRPFAHDSAMAMGVALYADAFAETPFETWRFKERIAATLPTHAEYRAILKEIVRGQGVQALIVSSLIGHSLDALDTGLPTVIVCHDYFPWCPAINLYYDGVCEKCDGERVSACAAGNAEYSAFDGYGPEARIAVRDRFVELVRLPNVQLVAPSESVGRNLKRLEPRFADLRFHVIPHGYGEPLPHVDLPAPDPGERLRVIVLGQVSHAKGLPLLREALPRITPFADVHFIGARESGEFFRYDRHVTVVGDYRISELPGHVRAVRPHVGLLASIVSETYGYALSELFMMGVPPVATRVGAFPERIDDGSTGFLYQPTAAALVAKLREVDIDRDKLAAVRARLGTFRHRSSQEMVADYHRLLPLDAATSPADFPQAASAAAEEVVTLANMWKQVRAAHLQASIANEARQRTEMRVRQCEERLVEFGAQIASSERELVQKELKLQDTERELGLARAKVDEILGSTSWRITTPLRWSVGQVPAMRRGLRVLARAALDPRAAAVRARELAATWRAEGWEGVRRATSGIASIEENADAWYQYRGAFARDVRHGIEARIAALPRRPRVSVIVPTYNPPESMLRRMLDSVRAQLYPEWELCVADDGSNAPHVRGVLDQYAALDARIKVSYAAANAGVSSASNRALAAATGEFAALLDHDDLLEEHALFRIAESIVEDDPDIVYSDEALTAPDGETVIRFAQRPAFSPEYLRSHPYIVHLTAFRTELLRAVGGWNEELRISQDYDLLLRASERARKIVHIPEILYRWRIHPASSGTAQQARVMETSKGILRQHLARSGLVGTIEEGPSFNFFSPRYSLASGLRVAIIIPTRNHGEILRQCIDSIRATVREVPYDIFVVDHESEDPATRAYLASLTGQARVIRHAGPFNFSAINNRAVAEVPAGYTHYLLCNNDIEAHEGGWLERMLELGQQPDVGVVGAMLLYPDRKTIQHGGVGVGLFRGAEHYGKFLRFPEESHRAGREVLSINREVAAVTAACMLVRSDAWHAVGGFDEAIAVGFGDVDFCLRVLETGRRVVYCAQARLLHHESLTRGVSEIDPHPVDTSSFRAKWQDLLARGDPYYNPGLSTTSTRFDVRRPLPFSVDVRRRVAVRGEAPASWRIAAPAPKVHAG